MTLATIRRSCRSKVSRHCHSACCQPQKKSPAKPQPDRVVSHCPDIQVYLEATGRTDNTTHENGYSSPHRRTDKAARYFKARGRAEGKLCSGRQFRRVRCRECPTCTREDCRQCSYCRDMRKYGGPSRLKQRCIHKRCIRPLLPKGAVCIICRNGEQRKVSYFQSYSPLMECGVCWETVHTHCFTRLYAIFGAGLGNGIINAELSNRWTCPRCCYGTREKTMVIYQGHVGCDQTADMDCDDGQPPVTSVLTPDTPNMPRDIHHTPNMLVGQVLGHQTADIDCDGTQPAVTSMLTPDTPQCVQHSPNTLTEQAGVDHTADMDFDRGQTRATDTPNMPLDVRRRLRMFAWQSGAISCGKYTIRRDHNYATQVFKSVKNKLSGGCVEAGGSIQEVTNYMRRIWIDGSTWRVENWSVFRESVRTNNDVGGWHRRINTRAGKADLGFYVLVPLLKKEAAIVDLQIRLVSEHQLTRFHRKKYARVHGRLFDAWDIDIMFP